MWESISTMASAGIAKIAINMDWRRSPGNWAQILTRVLTVWTVIHIEQRLEIFIYIFIPSNHTHFLLKSRMALFTSNITPAMNIAQASQTSTNLTIAPGDFNRPTNQDFHEHNGEVHRRGSAWRCGFVVPHLDLSKSLHQVGGFDGNQDMYDMYLKHYKAMWPLFVGLDPYTLAEFSVSAVPKMWPIEIPRFAGLDLQDHFRNPYGRGGKAPE